MMSFFEDTSISYQEEGTPAEYITLSPEDPFQEYTEELNEECINGQPPSDLPNKEDSDSSSDDNDASFIDSLIQQGIKDLKKRSLRKPPPALPPKNCVLLNGGQQGANKHFYQKLSYPKFKNQANSISLICNNGIPESRPPPQPDVFADQPRAYQVEGTPRDSTCNSPPPLYAPHLHTPDNEGTLEDNVFPNPEEASAASIAPKLRTRPYKAKEANTNDPPSISFHPPGILESNHETPLMFSRSSSLSSLSSLEGAASPNPDETAGSEYSHEVSRAVSPSDLPDSPPTCRSSSQNRNQNELPEALARDVFGPPSGESLRSFDQNVGLPPSSSPMGIPIPAGDSLHVYHTEDTPVVLSYHNSGLLSPIGSPTITSSSSFLHTLDVLPQDSLVPDGDDEPLDLSVKNKSLLNKNDRASSGSPRLDSLNVENLASNLSTCSSRNCLPYDVIDDDVPLDLSLKSQRANTKTSHPPPKLGHPLKPLSHKEPAPISSSVNLPIAKTHHPVFYEPPYLHKESHSSTRISSPLIASFERLKIESFTGMPNNIRQHSSAPICHSPSPAHSQGFASYSLQKSSMHTCKHKLDEMACVPNFSNAHKNMYSHYISSPSTHEGYGCHVPLPHPKQNFSPRHYRSPASHSSLQEASNIIASSSHFQNRKLPPSQNKEVRVKMQRSVQVLPCSSTVSLAPSRMNNGCHPTYSCNYRHQRGQPSDAYNHAQRMPCSSPSGNVASFSSRSLKYQAKVVQKSPWNSYLLPMDTIKSFETEGTPYCQSGNNSGALSPLTLPSSPKSDSKSIDLRDPPDARGAFKYAQEPNKASLHSFGPLLYPKNDDYWVSLVSKAGNEDTLHQYATEDTPANLSLVNSRALSPITIPSSPHHSAQKQPAKSYTDRALSPIEIPPLSPLKQNGPLLPNLEPDTIISFNVEDTPLQLSQRTSGALSPLSIASVPEEDSSTNHQEQVPSTLVETSEENMHRFILDCNLSNASSVEGSPLVTTPNPQSSEHTLHNSPSRQGAPEKVMEEDLSNSATNLIKSAVDDQYIAQQELALSKRPKNLHFDKLKSIGNGCSILSPLKEEEEEEEDDTSNIPSNLGIGMELSPQPCSSASLDTTLVSGEEDSQNDEKGERKNNKGTSSFSITSQANLRRERRNRHFKMSPKSKKSLNALLSPPSLFVVSKNFAGSDDDEDPDIEDEDNLVLLKCIMAGMPPTKKKTDFSINVHHSGASATSGAVENSPEKVTKEVSEFSEQNRLALIEVDVLTSKNLENELTSKIESKEKPILLLSKIEDGLHPSKNPISHQNEKETENMTSDASSSQMPSDSLQEKQMIENVALDPKDSCVSGKETLTEPTMESNPEVDGSPVKKGNQHQTGSQTEREASAPLNGVLGQSDPKVDDSFSTNKDADASGSKASSTLQLSPQSEEDSSSLQQKPPCTIPKPVVSSPCLLTRSLSSSSSDLEVCEKAVQPKGGSLSSGNKEKSKPPILHPKPSLPCPSKGKPSPASPPARDVNSRGKPRPPILCPKPSRQVLVEKGLIDLLRENSNFNDAEKQEASVDSRSLLQDPDPSSPSTDHLELDSKREDSLLNGLESLEISCGDVNVEDQKSPKSSPDKVSKETSDESNPVETPSFKDEAKDLPSHFQGLKLKDQEENPRINGEDVPEAFAPIEDKNDPCENNSPQPLQNSCLSDEPNESGNHDVVGVEASSKEATCENVPPTSLDGAPQEKCIDSFMLPSNESPPHEKQSETNALPVPEEENVSLIIQEPPLAKPPQVVHISHPFSASEPALAECSNKSKEDQPSSPKPSEAILQKDLSEEAQRTFASCPKTQTSLPSLLSSSSESEEDPEESRLLQECILLGMPKKKSKKKGKFLSSFFFSKEKKTGDLKSLGGECNSSSQVHPVMPRVIHKTYGKKPNNPDISSLVPRESTNRVKHTTKEGEGYNSSPEADEDEIIREVILAGMLSSHQSSEPPGGAFSRGQYRGSERSVLRSNASKIPPQHRSLSQRAFREATTPSSMPSSERARSSSSRKSPSSHRALYCPNSTVSKYPINFLADDKYAVPAPVASPTAPNRKHFDRSLKQALSLREQKSSKGHIPKTALQNNEDAYDSNIGPVAATTVNNEAIVENTKPSKRWWGFFGSKIKPSVFADTTKQYGKDKG